MGNFLDILSGKIFRFKNANGSDINAGVSDKLIVTPEALSKSDAFSNTSISLVLPASLVSKSNTFTANAASFIIPANGGFFPKRKSIVQAQLFAFVLCDAGTSGELCVWDANTNAAVPNTNFSFTNTAWVCVNGNIIELEAGKIYTIALRRLTGTSPKAVQVKAATLTIKFLSI
ncbi:MAG: hypothetical protein ACJ77K_08140 [Bacteroidia bacterium]